VLTVPLAGGGGGVGGPGGVGGLGGVTGLGVTVVLPQAARNAVRVTARAMLEITWIAVRFMGSPPALVREGDCQPGSTGVETLFFR
jgi:hypothetical protein